MSRYHKEQIESPHCHHKGEFDLWESVNVDLDRDFGKEAFRLERLARPRQIRLARTRRLDRPAAAFEKRRA